ncbi:hypothetical protein UPYG_G00211440 [Umbra pygmaea]|uniref:ADAM metallopeptidase domain 19b n=1 Tax=Umbra pygmaea TaxID=75934 RepID=A0ABD0WJT7_UMBPY
MNRGQQLTRVDVCNGSAVYFCQCLYLKLFFFCCVGIVISSHDNHAEQHSTKQRLISGEGSAVTYPLWMQTAKRKRTSDGKQQHPSEAEVVITAEGEEMTLRLHRNEQLLAPGYQEIWYSPSGFRQTSSPPSTGHCFYHGDVRGVEGSSVALSTCSGLRGLITVNSSVSYLIEPLSAIAVDLQHPHAVFRSQQVQMPNGTCGHLYSNLAQEDRLNDLIQGMLSARGRRERRDVAQSMKYVELLLVADHAEFQKHQGNLEMTKLKLLEAANYVDKYYKALRIRVAVIGLEVWSDQDRISVSENPYSTLGAFLAWRRKQLYRLPNDNAQLVTGVSFLGTTIGLAPLRAMCSDYQSGGINSDHSNSAVGVAATMAHEMGHNFGMSHDNADCCLARPDDGGCIMAAATGHPFPRVFNSCNQRELSGYLGSGGGKCLFNLPNTTAMYGGRRCGNGYLEDGEECDCGDEEECSSPCCNAKNCTLKAGAECAHGVCCHSCKLKSPGELCRAPSGSCDLPEYCDGKVGSCPSNFYLVDGTSCAGGRAYCYTGMCLTLEQQCQSLWGRDGRPAPDTCFNEVNKAGDQYGNCGKDLVGKYRSCKDRDAKCGKIQCVSSASKPIETNAVGIDTTVRLGSTKILCKGTHVYQGQEDEGQGDTLDPGLVMTGTKCGEDAICFGGECRNASFLRADECNAKCNGHGLCNNYHHCHCDLGWAPPLCDKEGNGGSEDSGPVNHHRRLLPVLLFLLVPFVIFAVVGLWCYYRHNLQKTPLKDSASPPELIRPGSSPVRVEDKHVQANDHANSHHANGHVNPTFLLKRQSLERLGQSTPSPSTKNRHAFVRPTVKPPPVPDYAARPSQTQPSIQSLHPASLQPQSKPLSIPGYLALPPPVTLPPSPQSSPSLPHTHRPKPPNRPPPPCPLTKPSRGPLRSSPQVLSDGLKRGACSLAPSDEHTKFSKSQNKISGMR